MRLLTIALIGLSSPVLAQTQTFSLPAGCTAYLTVQSAACSVSHHFTCTNYEPGVQGRIDLDQLGATYIGTIDAEAQWLNSFSPADGSTETLEPGAIDPASFSELLRAGTDGYDFQTLNDQTGLTRFVGRDTLTGNTVTIDGVTLEETSYEIAASLEDGTELWRTAGREYISRDWRMFLSGVAKTYVGTENFEVDGSPVEFIFPGEPGFLSANPKHGCGEVTSQLEVPGAVFPVAFAIE